jgi:hypothetical protein
MEITRELLDNEIAAAEKVQADTQRQYNTVEGGLLALRQLRALLDREAAPAAESQSCPAPPAV